MFLFLFLRCNFLTSILLKSDRKFIRKHEKSKKTDKLMQKSKKTHQQNVFYFQFYIRGANFRKIDQQMKIFPKIWVDPLKQAPGAQPD